MNTATSAADSAPAAAMRDTGERSHGLVEAPAPDPRALAGIIRAVYGRCEVAARAVVPLRRQPLGRVLAELEHARILGLVEQARPGAYACTAAAEQVPAPEAKAVASARWRAGRFLLACLRKSAALTPYCLLPDARVGRLPAPDPQILDAHTALWWARLHHPAVVLVAGEAADDVRDHKQLGMLALDLALAALTVAVGDVAERERLAKAAYAAALAIGDRRGEAGALEHLGTVRTAQGSLEQALRDHRQALALREKTRDVRGIISSTNEVGLAQWALGEHGAARASLRQAITLADTCTDRDFSALARQNLAAVLLDAAELSPTTRTAVFELLDKASARHGAVGALAAQGRCASLHAAALRRDGGPGDLTMAVAVAREAVTAAESSGRIDAAAGAYAELARCLAAAGRRKEAAAWAKTAIALSTAAGMHALAEALTAEFTQPARADPAHSAEHEDA